MKACLCALLLTLSTAAFTQRQGCVVHIVSHAKHPPQTLTLVQPISVRSPATVYSFTDSCVVFVDSIEHPLVITLLIDYAGATGIKFRYPVFLMPGELFVQLNEDQEDDKEYVDGPPMSHDFTALLEQPVAHVNRQIGHLMHELDSTRQIKGDTQSIKNELADVARHCWEIPRAYIQANPGSILSLTALRMMGSGDPTCKDPNAELHQLFNSLALDLRESPEGKFYAAHVMDSPGPGARRPALHQ